MLTGARRSDRLYVVAHPQCWGESRKHELCTHVEPNIALGDDSDIDAARVDDAWYLVFRETWGDCPSGCLYSALHYPASPISFLPEVVLGS